MSTNPALTRRSVLAGASLTAAAVTTIAGPPAAATPFFSKGRRHDLPQVTPVWSEELRRGFGICAHPNFTKTVYGHDAEWLSHLGDLGVGYFRGLYCPSLAVTMRVVKYCRKNGIKWLMLVMPTNWSLSDEKLDATLAHIRDNAADVCIGIEGPNEPNHNRGGGSVRSDWASATLACQKRIYDFVKSTPALSHVEVVGPSLQLGASNPYPDFVKLANVGIGKYMDVAGVHSYPGGFKPDNNLDMRIGWAKSAWGQPSWITETGYNNALATTSGHKPVPDEVSRVYGPRTYLEGARRGCKVTRFELLDDPDPGNENVEANFGLLACPSDDPSTWTRKPEFRRLQRFLNGLKDTAESSYRPTPVGVSVSGPDNLRWLAVGRSDGSARLLMYLDAQVYDPLRKAKLMTNTVDVTVTDKAGSRVIQARPGVRSVPLR